MKIFKIIVFTFIFSVFISTAVNAQVSQSGKLAIIDTRAFDNEKTGILKFFKGMDSVDKEFAPINAQIQALVTKQENIRKEVESLQAQAQKTPTVPIKQETITGKADEFERLGREIKFKQEAGKADYARRKQIVMEPILLDIGKAMEEFATQKGYALILDFGKLDQAGVILALNKTADVTAEFIKFYNARPAGTAATKP
jgi:Skp family chaperone for outer membrane proteins